MKMTLKDRRLPWLIIAGFLILGFLTTLIISSCMVAQQGSSQVSIDILIWLVYGVLLALALLPIGLRLKVLNERYEQNPKLEALSWVFIIPGAIVSGLATIGWIFDLETIIQSSTPPDLGTIIAIALYIILDTLTVYVLFIRKNKHNKQP